MYVCPISSLLTVLSYLGSVVTALLLGAWFGSAPAVAALYNALTQLHVRDTQQISRDTQLHSRGTELYSKYLQTRKSKLHYNQLLEDLRSKSQVATTNHDNRENTVLQDNYNNIETIIALKQFIKNRENIDLSNQNSHLWMKYYNKTDYFSLKSNFGFSNIQRKSFTKPLNISRISTQTKNNSKIKHFHNRKSANIFKQDTIEFYSLPNFKNNTGGHRKLRHWDNFKSLSTELDFFPNKCQEPARPDRASSDSSEGAESDNSGSVKIFQRAMNEYAAPCHCNGRRCSRATDHSHKHEHHQRHGHQHPHEHEHRHKHGSNHRHANMLDHELAKHTQHYVSITHV